jgi:hypothetical protein
MIKKKTKAKTKAKTTVKAKTGLNFETIPALHESVISRVNSDQTVSIVNLELDSVCYSLDGIAAGIWGEIDGKKSLEDIRNLMIKKYDPPISQFDKDFKKLVSKLTKENLITI